MSKSPIRTAGRGGAQSSTQTSNSAHHTVDIRAWARMLVERGNRLVERAERERVALNGAPQRISTSGPVRPAGRSNRAGESHRIPRKETGSGMKPG